MKRTTARVFDRFPHAWDLNEVLQRGGVDSKIVTKHAVQIRPDQVEQALEICRAEKLRRATEEAQKEAEVA